MIKLQQLFQRERSYSSNLMVLIIIKQQLFLITFNRHSNHLTSLILLLFPNGVANIVCVAYCMNFFIIELTSKVFIVISNTLEYTSYHFLNRLRYVTSNFSNWPTVKFQFWREYVSLPRTKLFRILTLVLRCILEFWMRFAMVANFAHTVCIRWLISMSSVLGLFWEIN